MERPCKDSERRSMSTHRRRCKDKPNLMAPWSWTPGLWVCEKQTVAVSATYLWYSVKTALANQYSKEGDPSRLSFISLIYGAPILKDCITTWTATQDVLALLFGTEFQPIPEMSLKLGNSRCVAGRLRYAVAKDR